MTSFRDLSDLFGSVLNLLTLSWAEESSQVDAWSRQTPRGSHWPYGVAHGRPDPRRHEVNPRRGAYLLRSRLQGLCRASLGWVSYQRQPPTSGGAAAPLCISPCRDPGQVSVMLPAVDSRQITICKVCRFAQSLLSRSKEPSLIGAVVTSQIVGITQWLASRSGAAYLTCPARMGRRSLMVPTGGSGDHQGRRLSLEIAPDWGLTHVSSCMGNLRHARLWLGSQRKVSAARRPRASPTAGLDPATPQCFDTAPRSIHWHERPHLISAH